MQVILGEGNLIFFFFTGSWENFFGLVGRQNNNLCLRVGTSKNKNIDQWSRETHDYESDLMSLLCDSTMLSVLNLQQKRKINGKKKNVYMWNQYFDLPKITVGWASKTEN